MLESHRHLKKELLCSVLTNKNATWGAENSPFTQGTHTDTGEE